jgi:CPA2 family monovalent cation:H+ antiporter-2
MGEAHLESYLFVDLVTVVIAAFFGGVIARVLRAPPVLGYLAMGMIIGPYVAGRSGDEWLHFATIADVATVHKLAEIGVVLLVFAIGIEISFRELVSLGKVIVVGGLLQISITAALLMPIGLLLGLDITTSIILGMVGALSSTMVVLKTLTDRGEIHSLHGRLLTGFLLMQDLVFILMIAMLPALGGSGGIEVLKEAGWGVLKTTIVIGGVALLGIKVMPLVMSRITVLGSREVFVLMVMAIVFAISGLTNFVGLSAALGAFVAGLLLSESDIGHWALAEVAPLRDIFAALFFASLGMLTDPVFIFDHYGTVIAVIGSAVVIKFLVTAIIVRVSGYLPSTALLTGVGMGQIGEFSFILVAGALAIGVVDQSFHSLIVVSAVLTMAAGPPVISGGTHLVTVLSRRFRVLRPYRIGDPHSEERPRQTFGHVVICGLGRVGSLVAQELREHGVPFTVVDLDPRTLDEWRGNGYHTILGSSDRVEVLRAARVAQAGLLVITTGDPVSVEMTAYQALQLQPGLDIVARVRARSEGEDLQHMGVQEVVWPEMEAGLEIVRHSLSRYQTPEYEVDRVIYQLRERLSFVVPEGSRRVPRPGADGNRPGADGNRPGADGSGNNAVGSEEKGSESQSSGNSARTTRPGARRLRD